MPDFFFHGVRHIVETKIAELRLLFDHVPNRGSGKLNDHHEYRDEMTSALELWAAHIERLIAPADVQVLR
jgi:hypothetical protein